MKKLIDAVHNLNFRLKILLSFILIGVLPFAALSMHNLFQTSANLSRNEEREFATDYSNTVARIEKEAGNILRATQMLSSDTAVSSVLTAEYQSEYEKYFQTTQRFDTIVQTVLFTTPEITRLDFYVPNSLADVRVNMHPLSDLKSAYRPASLMANVKWAVEGDTVFVYRAVLNADDYTRCAVLCARINRDRLLDLQLPANTFCRVSISGTPVSDNLGSASTEGDMRLSSSVLNGAGAVEMYRPRSFSSQTNRTMLSAWLLTFAGLAALLLVISYISRALVKRLDRLNRELSVTVQNRFENTLTEDYRDEIGQLTATANRMILDTRALIRDVYQSRLMQKEYEIQALQAQINPHFLYNVLSAVNWRAITTGDEEISGIVTSLSRFYRTVLNSGSSVTTIRNEMENINAYVSIQLAIHNRSFDFVCEADESVFDCRMPNLIVQPLVENAIEHGIDRKTDGRGLLKVTVSAEGDYLCFRICDNGPAFPAEDIARLIREKKQSYGLYNVKKRLGLFYGGRFELRLTRGEMTTSLVRIPKVFEREDLPGA